MGALDTSLPQVELFDANVIQYELHSTKRNSLVLRRTLEPLLFDAKGDDVASSEDGRVKKHLKNQSYIGKSPFMEEGMREGFVN